MEGSKKFFNRELSWIEFNARVLYEACRNDVPLFERLKFLTIATSNADEFFMVRVAGLKRQLITDPKRRDIAGLTPEEQLKRISKRTRELIDIQYDCLNKDILPALSKIHIEYVPVTEFTSQQSIYAESLFHNEIFPLLTPLRTDSEDFPHISNLRLHAAFLLRPIENILTLPNSFITENQSGKAEADTNKRHLAIVQIPTSISRIVWLPAASGKRPFTVLDDIITLFGTRLFPGYTVDETLLFKVTRDADFSVDEDADHDFILAMEEVLEKRQSSLPVRLTCNDTSPTIRDMLMEKLGLSKQDVFQVTGIPDPSTLLDLTSAEIPHKRNNPLEYSTWQNFYPQGLSKNAPLWDTLKQHDVLLHVPYESYEPVISFINNASEDPSVLAIKMTLYRTSGNSPIVHALERAARNGKQVTVFVEVKARFDEKRNISWASQLEHSGVIVVHGIANLKVHAKLLLVVRKESDGIRRYVHISTGNYNDKTAKIYSDLSLFTCSPEMANDATLFFNMISGYSSIQTMKQLYMAPINLKTQLLSMIEREILHSTPESPGLIMAKMNSLAHPEIIEALYRANKANVNIMLNVRGICMLIPGVTGLSEHITVTGIIDRYLEHARIFYFQNGGSEELYLSSADWMPRNLDRRVELMFPIVQEDIFKKVKDTLLLYFSDNCKSFHLQSDGSWIPSTPAKAEPLIRAQESLYNNFKRANDVKAKEMPKEFVVRRHR